MTIFLRSTVGEVTGSQNLTGYKSNSKKLCTEAKHLKSLLKSNLNSLIFAHFNISPIRNKFAFLAKHLTNDVDLLMISETKTKINNSFPEDHFLIKGFLNLLE